MSFPEIQVKIPRRQKQDLQILGINLTDNYVDGQMESCKGITSDRFPYIATIDQKQPVETGITEGFEPVAMFAWERLFVVSNEPGENGYKCYYGGEYCGDAVNLDMPKQFAVVNSHLVMWPDKIYFNLYDETMEARPLTTAPRLIRIDSGQIVYKEALT